MDSLSRRGYPSRRLCTDLSVEFGEPPAVKTAIHILAVVHRLPDVRQVFQNQHGVLDGFGVLHDFADHTVEHIVYLVPQIVAEQLGDTATSAFLKPLCSGEVGGGTLEPMSAIHRYGPRREHSHIDVLDRLTDNGFYNRKRLCT
jgi:hypothetical protein